ncbi:Clavaminate synthase-like protein [Fomitopsis betulina]|nr:Clavaminate synthase-like protein [Fomitopsis betulina]
MDVNHLHHDPSAAQRKRTSIHQLLNPIGPPPSLDQQYAQQLPSVSQFMPQAHPSHVPVMPPPQYPSSLNSQPSFSLRTASWDHSATKVQDDFGGRPQSDPNACRYDPPAMPPQHQYYQDSYSRSSRPVDEPPSYAMGGPSWATASEPVHTSYSMYSNDRTAIPTASASRSPLPSPHSSATMSSHSPASEYATRPHHHQHHHYEQDITPRHQYTPPTDWQVGDRVSLRLAEARSIPTQASQALPPISLPPQPQHYQANPHALGYPSVPFAIPVAAYPPTVVSAAPKRQMEQSDDESGSKSKKARSNARQAKSTESNAQSRRGYSAKKRNEAAQIAAQNAQLMPTVSYVHVSNEKGKEKAPSNNPQGPMRIVGEEDTSQLETSGPLHPELQFARCMSNRYRSEEFPRCVSCTRRWAGDTCRFQGIRFFLKNDKKQIVGISFVENQKPDAPTMTFPEKWNVNLQKAHIHRTKRTVAEALLPTLKKELEHLSLNEVIRRPRESEVRATCDTCMTSIFSSSWMCRLCGREACAECYEQVKELTIDRAGAPEAEIAALQARREKHAHINPFFLSCTRRNEHQAKDFSPMSRFCKPELEEVIKDMDILLAECPPERATPEPGRDASLSPSGTASPPWSDAVASSSVPGTRYSAPAPYSDSLGGVPPEPSSFAAGITVPSHITRHFADGQLTDDIFRRIWARGEPIVVTGLLPKFHVQWSPEYFVAKYGSQSCLILECQSDQNRRVTVGEFFSWFGKYEGRRDCWKLKDWPPSTDFRTAFPELYDDFANATPVPNYVRRDGVLNLASHFPSNTVAPDLGPRMYNAMASFDTKDSKGTTRLHMDMADVVNIMLYAAGTPAGGEGCAAWDLFKAEDAPKLRKYMRKKFKGQFQHDPIHSQQFYLDSTHREELFKEYGVKSHRVYQKPGEAVFIPAGCAHQVCNLADCIKVASDFVSPENIERCEMLTREFREQNQSMAWKEDVLQLRTMMWFAWLSCARQEKDA